MKNDRSCILWQIELSCLTGNPIAVDSEKDKERLKNLAIKLGTKIPDPVVLMKHETDGIYYQSKND